MNMLLDRSTMSFCRIASAGLIIVFSGCAVGPDFERPQPPPVKGYTSDAPVSVLAAGPGEPVQKISFGQNLPEQWWELFHSQRLNQVIREALAGSPTLASAQATLAQAQQAVIVARGGYYPQLDAVASAQRLHNSTVGVSGVTSNLYSVGATASFAPDVFGGTRRHVEQQEALAENQQQQLAAAYLALTGNAATQAITIAAVRLQIGAVEEILTNDQQNLQLVQLKFQAGKASHLDELTAESQLASDQALLYPLEQQLSVAQHALAVLAGHFPGEWASPDFDLTEFTLPGELPLSIPSELVHRRPDILAAEAQLHASSAAIGVATAQLYPSLSISGTLGFRSFSSATLFQGTNPYSSVIANLTQPIFHGGALRAQKQAAVDAFQASFATYRQTVLSAFGQVADVLQALEHDAQLVAAQKDALDISTNSLTLQRESYTAGKSDLLQLITAERAYQEARVGYARAQAQRYQDTTQLFVAMGGGWCDCKTDVSDKAQVAGDAKAKKSP